MRCRGAAAAAWAAEGRVAAARTGAGGWSKRTMSPSACPLVQQRWALRRVKNECARRAEGGALALLPKLAVVGASAIGSATLSVKATRSRQEGGGRQSGDGVGGGEVGGERGETRGATAARSEQRALVRDVADVVRHGERQGHARTSRRR